MKYFISLLLVCHCLLATAGKDYKYYSRVQLEEDMAILQSRLTKIHPRFLNNSFRQQWEKQFEAVKSSIPDSMTQNGFYQLVAPLVAAVDDGHTGMSCAVNDRMHYMKNGGLSFPFFLDVRNDQLFVSHYCGEDTTLFSKGEEILQINERNANELISDMRHLIGGKHPQIKNGMVAHYFRTLIWMLYGFEDDYELAIKTSSGEIKQLKVEGITNQQFRKNLPKSMTVPQKPYDLEIHAGKNIAHLKIGSFYDLNGFCAFADSAFQLIDQKSITDLVIDIRGNGGGRSVVVDSLMNYLTDQSYAQYKTIETRVSQPLLDYYSQKYPETYEKLKLKPIDYLSIVSGSMKVPHEMQHRYSGQLYLLIDDQSYSAAATFAGLFRELKMGIIIGQETKGTIEYYGDFWMHYLPHTKLDFYVSPKRFVQYGGTDPDRGVVPDYSIQDEEGMKFTYQLIHELNAKNTVLH